MRPGLLRGCACLLLGFWAIAAAAALPAPLRQALRQTGLPEDSVAVYVHEIGREQPALTHGAERAVNPASTIKLLTTFAALDMLGPAYAWTTEVYAGGPLSGGVLEGDLILRGSGDPKLTLEAFWLMLRGLRARGVRDIRGGLVLDRTAFAVDNGDAGRFDSEPSRPYNTLPDALLVNYKSIRVTFVPDPAARTVAVVAEPPLPQARIASQVALDGAPCGDWLARVKSDVQGNGDTVRLAFSGAFAAGCGEKVRHYSVLGHSQYVHALFSLLWGELGGTLAGGWRDGPVPAGARLVFAAQSPPLAEVIRDINKFSNNVMARQLFLTLGAAAFGAPATGDKATRAVRQWAAERGLELPELVLENGSGLSRNERISARGLGEVLLAAARSPLLPELMSSLPLAAVDGTMKRRLSGADVAGQAHIKTGSLANVRAGAGYVLDARGRRVVVVAIVNHPQAVTAQPLLDAVLNWAYRR